MSHSLAEQLGRTWQRGELCRVQLDGLSRRSADLLFSRRLQDPGLAKVMASYDEAVKRATGERCDRKVLDEEIRRSDAALRAYLQLAAPYRVEIGPSQGPRPY